MSIILIIFIYFNSKFKATCKKEEFECRCIKAHSWKKSKTYIISVAILFLFFLIKILAILSTLELIFFDNTIKHVKRVSGCFFFSPENRDLGNGFWILKDWFFLQFDALVTDQICSLKTELFPDFESLECKFFKDCDSRWKWGLKELTNSEMGVLGIQLGFWIGGVILITFLSPWIKLTTHNEDDIFS